MATFLGFALILLLALGGNGLVEEVEYTVVVHAVGGAPLGEVELFLITGDEERLLATTDSVGIATFEAQDIPNIDAGALIACRGGYYCGGWRLSEGAFPSEDQWMNIELAPIVVY